MGRPGDELPDDCKLYVGNLSPVLTDATLKSMFEPFGAVLHAAAVIDPTTGQGKGFGFVHYADAGSARMAAQGLHGKVGSAASTGCQGGSLSWSEGAWLGPCGAVGSP